MRELQCEIHEYALKHEIGIRFRNVSSRPDRTGSQVGFERDGRVDSLADTGRPGVLRLSDVCQEARGSLILARTGAIAITPVRGRIT